MSDYRYSLENGGLKYACPACRKVRFVRYVDTSTGEQVTDVVGRCDREDSCGYHLTPKEHFLLTGKNHFSSVSTPIRKRPVQEQEPSFIDAALMHATFTRYNENNFCRWLCGVFGEPRAFELVAVYKVGTAGRWPGSCVFWQVDRNGKTRRGKVMLYSTTGRRVKEPFNHITTVHSLMKLPQPQPEQCLFGEHLLSVDELRPVAIVESEKTAMVAAGFMPEFIWTATAGKGGLNREKLKAVRGRKVVLFPDLGAFEKWREVVKGMPGVTVSDILERRASGADRAAGLDLADYLLRENGFDR